MTVKRCALSCTILPFLVMTVLLWASGVHAHCDGMDGPVVTAAKKALETGDVNLILIWVQKEDEPEIRKVFDKTLTVRKLNAEAKDLADLYLFETLVRIHRAGEGAPYTGLKPAGRDLGPVIPAADKALEEAGIDPLIKLVTDEAAEGIRKHFNDAMAKKHFKADGVESGREYVKEYVTFIHYVEGIHQAIGSEAAQGPVPGPAQGGADPVHPH